MACIHISLKLCIILSFSFFPWLTVQKMKYQGLLNQITIFWFSISFSDEPEIQVEKVWVHADVGIEAEISCNVHAVPAAEVRFKRFYHVRTNFFFNLSFKSSFSLSFYLNTCHFLYSQPFHHLFLFFFLLEISFPMIYET